MDTIAAGVDGSDDALAAVRVAATEARLRGARLRLVGAWQIPPSVYSGAILWPIDELRTALEGDARSAVDAAAADIDTEGLEIETVVREGAPAQVLVDQSKDATMLVVGSRGRGGFSGLLLGSVSSHCAHHAHCPVVIVRGGVATG